MLTKKDKEEIKEIVENVVFKSQNKIYEDMVVLFTSTNERIDILDSKLVNMHQDLKNLTREVTEISAKLDGINDHLKDHHIIVKSHDKRIEELEHKVYTTTS